MKKIALMTLVDNLSHKISVDNIEFNLSPKEFELLNYFVINKKIGKNNR